MRSLTTAAFIVALSSGVATITPATAQMVPTIDMSVLAKATQTVTNTLNQVKSLTSIEGVIGKLSDTAGVGTQLGQLKGMLNVMGNPGDAIGAMTQMGQLKGISSLIGQLGSAGNMLNSIMKMASGGAGSGSSMPSLKGMMPSLGSASQFGSIGQNSRFSSSLSGLTSMFQSPSNNLPQMQQQVQQNLYYSGQGSAKDVEGINAARAANTRAAATGGMAVAVQGKDYLQKAEPEIKTLGQQAQGTKDLRGDVQANTAVMLKLLEAVQMGNAQLAAQTHLNSATAIMSDNYNAGSSGSSSGGN